MKLADKRFWILLIVIASAAVTSAQAVFSVEEVSYVENAKVSRKPRGNLEIIRILHFLIP